MKNINKIYIFVIALSVLIMIYIGPMNGLSHGHYYEEYDFSQIAEDDWQEQINLENEDFEVIFSPLKNYLNGFSICLYNQPEDNEGTLELNIYNDKDEKIGYITIDLRKPRTGNWYKVNTNIKFTKNKLYKIKFAAKECKYYPYLQKVKSDYLPDETVDGNILIAYSYARSTFNIQERVLIILCIIALDILLIGKLVGRDKKLKIASLVVFLTVVLSWNYMHNSIDTANSLYDYFQMDSEALVAGAISTANNVYEVTLVANILPELSNIVPLSAINSFDTVVRFAAISFKLLPFTLVNKDI